METGINKIKQAIKITSHGWVMILMAHMQHQHQLRPMPETMQTVALMLMVE
jgi:hypothetical protein